MNLTKIYNLSSPNQIWRLLLSDNNKLIVETRDVESKEVFFSCVGAYTGKYLFKDFQFDEKFWIGIESVQNDLIFFHKFASPDMPRHKEILAFDINSRKILWNSDEYSFLFILDQKIYCYKDKFEGRYFFALDMQNGNIAEELEKNVEEINKLKLLAESPDNYSDYLFPEIFNDRVEDSKAKKIIDDHIQKLDIVGNVEYNLYDNIILLNYHSKIIGSSLINKFVALEKYNGSILFSEILNSNIEVYVPDSFFVYKDLLFLLKEKKEVLVYKFDS